MAFTSLCNGFYADSALMLMGEALETGKLAVPEDGPISSTAHSDLAEAASIALRDGGKLEDLTPPLTGSEALDLAAIAAIASELTGHEVKRITLTDEEFRANMISQGTPELRTDSSVE